MSRGAVDEPSLTTTVARFTGRLVTPPLSVQVGGVPTGAVSSGHLESTTVWIQYVRPSGPVFVPTELVMDAQAPLLRVSICWSARVPAVEVLLARLIAPKPELKPATRAEMPTAVTVIATTSSTRPKPLSDVRRRNAVYLPPTTLNVGLAMRSRTGFDQLI